MKKARISFLVFFLLCLLIFAVSCGETPPVVDPEPTPEEPAEKTYVMVVPDTMDSYQQQYAVALRRLLNTDPEKELVYVKASAYSAGDYENPYLIAFGKTGLPAFAEAEAKIPSDPDVGAYYVFVSDTQACFIANHSLTLSMMMETINDSYLTEGIRSFSVDKGHSTEDFFTMSISDYYENIEKEKKEKYMASFENRWSEAEEKLSAETVAELKNFYELFGDNLIKLIADLYDPETGAFYYSLSAKQYEGFLPDLESTNQVLAFLSSSGLTAYYGNDLSAFFDGTMRNKLVAWIKGLQDKDGYFYHPQWGKSITNNRKNRDLNWAINSLKLFNQTPDYPTPSERLSDLDIALAGSTPVLLAGGSGGTEGLPDFLLSKEAFLAYLDSFGGVNRSMGNSISPLKGQIQAAGLFDVCLDYILAAEREDNGLFQESADYNAMGALYKLGGTVTTGKRQMKYYDKKIESCMSVILSDVTPSTIVDVYNPWAALNGVFKNMTATGVDPTPYHETVRENAPALLRKTLEKLRVFYKPDGGCSYYPNCSANVTQGTSVCIGLAESDVNATVIGVSNILTSIFASLGIEKVTMYSVTDADRLISLLKDATSFEKKTFVNEETETFEGEQMPAVIVSALSSYGKLSLTDDPLNEGNRVLKLQTTAGYGDLLTFNATHLPKTVTCYTFSGDFLIGAGFNSKEALQIGLRDSSDAYMFDFIVSSDKVTFRDRADSANTKKTTSVAYTASTDQWIRLVIEYYTEGKAKVFINGKCVLISDNFYGSDKEGALPAADVKQITLRAYKAGEGFILMDNLRGLSDDTKTFVPETVFVPEPEPVTVTQNFENETVGSLGAKISRSKSTTDVSVKEADGNKYLEFNTVEGTGEGVTWSCGTYSEISFDLTVVSCTGASYAYQISLGASKAAYMLDLVYDGTTVTVRDNATTLNVNTVTRLGSFEIGEKASFRIVYADGTATVYLNGVKLAESNNYYGADTDGSTPVAKADGLKFWGMKKAVGTLLIDNLSCK